MACAGKPPDSTFNLSIDSMRLQRRSLPIIGSAAAVNIEGGHAQFRRGSTAKLQNLQIPGFYFERFSLRYSLSEDPRRVEVQFPRELCAHTAPETLEFYIARSDCQTSNRSQLASPRISGRRQVGAKDPLPTTNRPRVLPLART